MTKFIILWTDWKDDGWTADIQICGYMDGQLDR